MNDILGLSLDPWRTGMADFARTHSMPASRDSRDTGRRARWLAWLWLNAAFLFLSGTVFGAQPAKMPPPIADAAAEPIRYVGKEQPDKRFYDGALRHAVGVHKYQALRANRTLGYNIEDRGGADQRVPLSVYRIDDLKTSMMEKQ